MSDQQLRGTEDLAIYGLHGGRQLNFNVANNASTRITVPQRGTVLGVAWQSEETVDATSGANRFFIDINGTNDNTVYFDVYNGTAAATRGEYYFANKQFVEAGDKIRLVSDGDQNAQSECYFTWLIRR